MGVTGLQNFVDQHIQQQEVNAYFQSQSSYWKEIYTSNGVYAEIHRNRYVKVLEWVDSLALVSGSKVLEIGCGAGYMAIALAQRGFQVYAIDSAEAMVEQACQQAIEVGVADRLSVDIGDVNSLAFEDESFDLVLAIGVIPWLERAEPAIQEMARLTRPRGHVILTADNRARLTSYLDPWQLPALRPLKRHVKILLERTKLRYRSPDDIDSTLHKCRFVDEALARFELFKIRSMTLGFGPFALFRRSILPEKPGIALHYRLQSLAERNVPVFRSTGAQYLVLARKSASVSLVKSTRSEGPDFNTSIT
jgi:2-polyprenyl-3-methyl-5-hydroxy-6-metoxy-1,4-benzoquinol methylase